MEVQELLDICQILYDEKTSLMVTLKLPKHLTCTHVGKVCPPSLLPCCIMRTNTHLTQGILHFKWQSRHFPTSPPLSHSHQKKQSIHFTNQTLQPPPPSINTNIPPRTPSSTSATTPHAPVTLKIKPPSAAAAVPPRTPTPSIAATAPKTTNRKKKEKAKDRERGAGPTPARDEGGQAKTKKIKTETGAAAGGGGGEKKRGAGVMAPSTPMMPPQTPTSTQKMVVPLKIKLKLNPGKGTGGSG